MDKKILEIKREILPVLKKHGVIKASIFGSFSRGEARKGSDVDILVEFKSTPSLFGLGGLYNELEGRLGRKVDIVTYGSISKRLRPFIIGDKVDIL